MHYIATAHGVYADGCVYTLKMITGEEMPVIPFLETMSRSDLKTEYLNLIKLIQQKEQDKFVFFVDFYGGTPFSVLTEIKEEFPKHDITIVTGLSLMMLIHVCTQGFTPNLALDLDSGIHIFSGTKQVKS